MTEKTFEEIFGKSTFIEHLTEKQQEELFSILKEKCLVKENVNEVIELKHLLFGERKRMQEEFLQWAEKNKAEICPMNVIAWFQGKIESNLKKELGLE